MNNVITVGLDLSLAGTGICVLNQGKASLRTIRTSPREFSDQYKRIDHIVEQCMFYTPESAALVCIESPFVRLCGRTVDAASKKLVALAHMVRRELTYNGIEFKEVAASQLKKFILGKGTGDKSQVLKEVYKRYAVDAGDDNQADACVLAHIAHAVLGHNRASLHAYQLDVAQKVMGA